MKGSWPKVTARIEVCFTASHSLPEIGVAAQHEHEYLVRAGWCHEIAPLQGCTKAIQDMHRDLDLLAQQLAGSDLNVALAPYPPTAENMACWLLARLPAYWQFVEIECYGGFFVRVEAGAMRAEWAEAYRK